jgi:hypothetical protein
VASPRRHLGTYLPLADRPRITIAFCSLQPEFSAALQQLHGSNQMDLVFRATVRATLAQCGGYECQEKEGVFMLAFHSMREGLEWGLTLQLALMEVRCGGSGHLDDIDRLWQDVPRPLLG